MLYVKILNFQLLDFYPAGFFFNSEMHLGPGNSIMIASEYQCHYLKSKYPLNPGSRMIQEMDK